MVERIKVFAIFCPRILLFVLDYKDLSGRGLILSDKNLTELLVYYRKILRGYKLQ
jgi:hypothetical protein